MTSILFPEIASFVLSWVKILREQQILWISSLCIFLHSPVNSCLYFLTFSLGTDCMIHSVCFFICSCLVGGHIFVSSELEWEICLKLPSNLREHVNRELNKNIGTFSLYLSPHKPGNLNISKARIALYVRVQQGEVRSLERYGVCRRHLKKFLRFSS